MKTIINTVELGRAMKQIFLLFIVLVTSLVSVHAEDFYVQYDFSYANETPSNVFATTSECIDVNCNQVQASPGVEFYSTGANSCFFAQTLAQMDACVAPFQVAANAIPNNGVIVKFVHDNTANQRFITHFSTNGDGYIVNRDIIFNIPAALPQFGFDFEINTIPVFFFKRSNGIAEIGQLNVVNLDDSQQPIQIDVPVSVDETVCSALRLNNPGEFRPTIPAGFSDFSAQTQVDLTVVQDSNSQTIVSQSIIIPIEADTCAGLGAFSFTPNSSLLGERITITATTDVVDNQFSTSIQDMAQTSQTVFPANLNGTCFVEVQNFTLSNINSFDLTTSVAQITQGESAFALFSAIGLRDEALTPNPFTAQLLVDGTVVSTQSFPGVSQFTDVSIDITSVAQTLAVGSHSVTLNVTPNSAGCTLAVDASHTQNLEILALDPNEVTFQVQDENGTVIPNANINLVLDAADDFFNGTFVFNQTLTTDANGLATFTGAPDGNFTFTITGIGFVDTTSELRVTDDTFLSITVTSQNVAPTINLPDSLTGGLNEALELNLLNFVTDFNDALTDLTFSFQIISGTPTIISNGANVNFTSGIPQSAVVQVTVTDPSGASDSDTITLNFLNTTRPEVLTFVADNDNGPVPHTTTFTIDTFDADNDTLTCSVDFGDGTVQTGACDALDGIAHTFQTIGTFNVVLTVDDGTLTQSATEQVFVFNFLNTTGNPIINEFSVVSSQGDNLPTDLTFTFNATHTQGLAMTCTLRINGVDNAVPCVGTFNLNNFNVQGTSTFTFTAVDTQNLQVVRTIVQDFGIPDEVPEINLFTLSAPSFITPTNVTLNFNATHTGNFPMNCTISFGSNTTNVPCIGSLTLNNFSQTGIVVFTFSATDNQSFTVTEQIAQEFFPQSALLSSLNSNLIIDSVIEPGEFEFSLKIFNESIRERVVDIVPTLTCEGATFGLNTPNGAFDSSAISRSGQDNSVFTFRVDTQDFEANIPKDVTCTFTVELRDNIGSLLTLSSNVKFEYAQEARQLQSIRGKGTDIADFMQTALAGGISQGFNSINFMVENNEEDTKELSITMTSRELGVNVLEEENLGPGQEREIQIPLFVGENVEPGLYPVRFSVYDGNDKQTRYTFIRVE